MSEADRHRVIRGCLFGTAVGDALGLPAEGLSRKAIQRRWGIVDQHHLLFGRGLLSDDTEHTVMAARAWLSHQHDAEAFRRALAWSFRWWLVALPAGIGWATLRAIVRLWLGVPVSKAGVASAGNGAAMRSPILGVLIDEHERRRHYVEASCRLTHRDPRAAEAALLASEAARAAGERLSTGEILRRLETEIVSAELRGHWTILKACLERSETVPFFAGQIGCGTAVSGFAPHTIAVAIYAWLRHRGDFRTTLVEVIACGGDTDTIAAIAGGIAGAESGEEGIPQPWIEGIADWPLSRTYLARLAEALSEGSNTLLPRGHGWARLPRNLIFLCIVLVHGLRRSFP